MIEQRWQRNLLVFTLPAIVLLFYATASLHFSYTPDDAYIYLQFAKNLVGGNGISFNAGEPVYGITSPLWLFIVSLGGRMGVDLYVAAKAIDLVLASLALIVFYFLAYEVIRDIGVALCATVAFSVNAWFLRWAGSGMETSLSVLLVLATILFCLRNEYFPAIVFSALLTLVRPEAALISGLILLDVYINSTSRARALKMILSLAIVYTVLVAPWLIYAYLTFGTIVPNTARGKVGWDFTGGEISSTMAAYVRTLVAADGSALLVLMIAGVVLIILLRRLPVDEKGSGRRLYLFRQSLIGIGLILSLSIFYIATSTNVVSRYLLLLTPFVTMYAFLFFFEAISLSRWQRYRYFGVLFLTTIVMLQNQFFYRRYVVPGIQAFEQGMELCLIPIGKWLSQNTPRESTVVTADIGAIGFYSDRRVCDAAGLASPALLPMIHPGQLPEDVIERKLFRACCSPDYLVHRSPIPEKLKGDPELVPLFTRPFAQTSLAETRTMFYTLYKVGRPAAADSTRGL